MNHWSILRTKKYILIKTISKLEDVDKFAELHQWSK